MLINAKQGTTIQLVCFLAAEFPVQMITKRLGFKRVLPTMMLLWGIVCMSSSPEAHGTRKHGANTRLTAWGQAWITNRASFYVTRALIGLFEGGFIPGTVTR